MDHQQFFWLHIKKSAGQSTRQLLQPHYHEVDRVKKPKNFTQAEPHEYNDILNNFRVVLGDLQFKRSLFARDYLYPDTWDQLYSFAFSRNPVDRAVSVFHYCYWRKEKLLKQTVRRALRSFDQRTLLYSTPKAFDTFLDAVALSHNGESTSEPLGLHFSTHTAPMSGDITDHDGRQLLTEVFRLEYLDQGIDRAYAATGLPPRGGPAVRINQSRQTTVYEPNRRQVAQIEKLYADDFDIYERAVH